MKRCPTCNREFTDPTLSFCIDDGATLLRVSDPQLESQRTALFTDPPPTVNMPPPQPTRSASNPFSYRPPEPPQPYGWAGDSAQQWVAPPPPVRQTGQQQTLAVVSLILGVLSITIGWICGGPILGLFAVVLGGIALMQIKNNPIHYTGKPFAFGGIATGGIALLATVAMFAFWIIMMIIGAATSH
jgi:hypothetical protein